MIDWHSHILPGMDDGSYDVAESLALIQKLSEQGVCTAIATPHFYANDESVDDFLKRRQKSYESLQKNLSDVFPDIMLGAEVRYYSGIGKLAKLDQLCIENTKLLLLEMPMEKWTEYTVRELIDIANTRNVKLILAHIERYISMQSNTVLDKLIESGILMQVNAGFFAEFQTRRKALSFLRKGQIHLVGSDCHGIKYRPPRIGQAFEIIRKKFGGKLIVQFIEYGYSLLNQK